MKTYPNQYVYPQYEAIQNGEYGSKELTTKGGTPLTKREYFAAMAMQGLMAVDNKGEGEWSEVLSKAAVISVQTADALIAELNKENS